MSGLITFDFLDPKQKCQSIILENRIISDPDLPILLNGKKAITWNFKKSLKTFPEITYLFLYSNGRPITDFATDDLKEKFLDQVKKHQTFLKTFRQCGLNLQNFCLYSALPEDFVEEFFSLKCEIMKGMFNSLEKPKNYDYLFGVAEIIEDIKQRRLSISFDRFIKELGTTRGTFLYQKLKKVKPFIDYNLFGTRTGRLTTKKNSFPILTLDKKARKVLYPTNDLLVELDFNSSELRTFLALCGNEQPQEDLHSWHQKQFNRVYKNGITRDEAKKKVLSWLYNGHKGYSIGIPAIEKMYNKKLLINKFWDGEFIETPFGKKLKSDEHHAISFAVQTTNAEVFYKQMNKVYHLLSGKKSFVKWMIHDAFVIDLALEEKGMLNEIVRTFGETPFGTYLTNLKIGKNFGEMKKVKL